MNSVNLIGNLTNEPELKKTQTGKSAVNFSVAINYREETYFSPCQAYGKIAENLSAYASKGSSLAVSGFLKQVKYTKQDGTKINNIVIIASSVSVQTKRKQTAKHEENEQLPL